MATQGKYGTRTVVAVEYDGNNLTEYWLLKEIEKIKAVYTVEVVREVSRK
jgi:hypothetical protein